MSLRYLSRPFADQALVETAARLASISVEKDFNVVRFEQDDCVVGLLHYPNFFEEAFPSLVRAWKIDLNAGRVSLRDYSDSLNPPILHRKELMLASDHPKQDAFQALTRELESLGLFDDTVRIGFRLQWNKLLTDRGFRVANHQLLPIGNDESPSQDDEQVTGSVEILRHRTALSRTTFSAPIHILTRHGFLDASRTVFDYGCGRGDDVRGLTENGIQVRGWDPVLRVRQTDWRGAYRKPRFRHQRD